MAMKHFIESLCSVIQNNDYWFGVNIGICHEGWVRTQNDILKVTLPRNTWHIFLIWSRSFSYSFSPLKNWNLLCHECSRIYDSTCFFETLKCSPRPLNLLSLFVAYAGRKTVAASLSFPKCFFDTYATLMRHRIMMGNVSVEFCLQIVFLAILIHNWTVTVIRNSQQNSCLSL